MIAFLCTENSKLEDNTIICSLDDSREWTIIRTFMFATPYSACEKQERQKEQGIRQYTLNQRKV
ncbi:MAG: hypothetical protein JWQ40_3919 [Segetibacter sp.]|nr:hypothetical protein [Segetibacter sp.]